jgi:hypothetical protein
MKNKERAQLEACIKKVRKFQSMVAKSLALLCITLLVTIA